MQYHQTPDCQSDDFKLFFSSLISYSLLERLKLVLNQEEEITSEEILERELYSFALSIQKGLEIVRNLASINKNYALQSAIDEILAALYPLENHITYTRALLDFHSGKSWQEVLHISRSSLAEIYLCAKSLYERNQYTEASHIFGFLAWIDSKNSEIWTILGHSLYYEQEYQRAISAYTVSFIIFPNNPWVAIYAAGACEAIGNYEKGCLFLEEALLLTKSQKDPIQIELHREIQQRLFSLIEKRDAIFS